MPIKVAIVEDDAGVRENLGRAGRRQKGFFIAPARMRYAEIALNNPA